MFTSTPDCATVYPDTTANLTIANSNNSVTSHTIQLSHNTPASDNPSSATNSPNVFWVKGVVRRDKVCPTWFHLSKVYSCVAMVTASTSESSGSESGSSVLSGWFQRLLMALAKQNLVLVRSALDKNEKLISSGTIISFYNFDQIFCQLGLN